LSFLQAHIVLNVFHFFFYLLVRQKTVQKPAEGKTKGQDKENKEGKRQRNFPEKNADRHGRHILDDKNDGQTGNHDEQDDLEIHSTTSRGIDYSWFNETPSSIRMQITVYPRQTQPKFIYKKSPAGFPAGLRSTFRLQSFFFSLC
jgi:hypothetical protein